MKSSNAYRDNPYALPNSSYGYTGYSSYGSYGSFGDYQNYSSYSNYNSYGNYGGYGSYNGYNDYDGYNDYGYQYQYQNLKEKGKLNESLEPNYQIKLLDSKKSNPDFSMPVVFQIDLALPLSFIIVNEKEDIHDYENRYQLASTLNNYNIRNHDLSLSSTSSSSSFSPYNLVETNDNETKNVIPNFDLEPVQGYLVDKQKEINQFKAFFFINGIEISIDTDKVITPPDTASNQDVNNHDITDTTTNNTIITNDNNSNNNSNSNNNQSTTYNQNEELIESQISNNLFNVNNNNNNNNNNNDNNSELESLFHLVSISDSLNNSSLLSSEENDIATSSIQDGTTQTNNNTSINNESTVVSTTSESIPLNNTMTLVELFLEKYRFTPEILKIQNVQWSEKFIYMIPKSVKEIDIKYLGSPEAESLKNGTNYLHNFIKKLSISSSTILRPRTRRTHRFYHSSTSVSSNRTTITVN